jgi:hypothetical protein
MNATLWVLLLCVIATAQSALQLTMDEGDMKLISSPSAEDKVATAEGSAPQKIARFTTSQVCEGVTSKFLSHALHCNVLCELDYEGH